MILRSSHPGKSSSVPALATYFPSLSPFIDIRPPYSVQIQDDCITAFQDFSRSHGKTKYIIYKIADDKKSVVVDSVGKDQDYEVFRNELADAKDSQGRASPRYAVYDVEYEIAGEGKRCALPSSQLFLRQPPR